MVVIGVPPDRFSIGNQIPEIGKETALSIEIGPHGFPGMGNVLAPPGIPGVPEPGRPSGQLRIELDIIAKDRGGILGRQIEMLLEMDQDTFPESRITQPAGVRYIFDQSIGQDVRHVHGAGEHALDGGGSPLSLPVQAHGGDPGGRGVHRLHIQISQHQDQSQGDAEDQHQKLGL